MQKIAELRQLAAYRRATRWPPYSSIGDYHCGKYDCEHVSPYTKTAGNVESDVFVLLHDWASEEWLTNAFRSNVAELGYDPTLPTNKTLTKALRDCFCAALADVYASNLFPFVKPGAMQGRIPSRHLAHAACEFALPEISIVAPDLVVCLGLATFNALGDVLDFRRRKTLDEAISNPMTVCGIKFWCQAHTGSRGQNGRNRLNVNQTSLDWIEMSRAHEGACHLQR